MAHFMENLAGWLLTYTVHSTVLLGLAWLVLRNRRVNAASSDLIWKAALVGGIVTASLQTGLNLSPAGSFSLVPAVDARSVTGAFQRSNLLDQASSPIPVDPVTAEPFVASPAPDAGASASPVPVTTILTWAWLAVATLLLFWYLGRRLILVGRLGDRQSVGDGDLSRHLETLRAGAGIRRRIRLTASQTISSPVALGRDEICLPSAALVDLAPDQQRAMLAHELAHLVRRDPHWLLAACLIERAFFFQPLNRLARRGVQETAELLSDDWAARLTGGVPLARCLVKVAEWMQASPLGLPVAGFAEERSQLSSRVTRLLETTVFGAPASRRTTAGLAIAALTLTVLFVPGAVGQPGLATDNSHPAADAEGDGPPMTAADTTIVRALMARLADEDAGVRAAAAEALGRIEHPMAIPALVAALRDPDRDVRHSVLDALSQFEAGIPAAPIRQLLTSDDPEARSRALEILGNLKDRESVAAVVRLLEDPVSEVRYEALHTLEHIGDRSAVGAIRRLLNDPDAEVRYAALNALRELDDDIDPAILRRVLADKNADMRQTALEIAEDRRMRVLAPEVTALVDDPNADVRQSALQALDEMGVRVSATILARALADQNGDVRQTALQLVGNQQLTEMVPQIIRMLNDANEDVRQEAAEALTELRTDAARAALRSAMTHNDPKVRRVAVEFFGEDRKP